VYVPIAETIRGFKEILDGKHDDLPERAFFMKGTIDEVVREAGDAAEREQARGRDEERSGEERSGEEEDRSEQDRGDRDGRGPESRAEETSGEPGTAG
jgi:hypothetical protein